MRIQILSLLLVACAEAESAGPTSDAGADADVSRPDSVTPWILPEDTAEPPNPLSPEVRSSALETAIDLALELEPDTVLALHDLLLPPPPPGSGDLTGCPVTLTYDYGEATAFFWQGECTGPDGTRYSGTGTIARYDDFPSDGGTYDGFEVSLAGRIEAPDGTWLEGAGRAGGFEGAGGDLTVWTRALEGTFRAGGPRAPADDPWLDGSRRSSLEVAGWTYVPTGGRSVTVVGALAGENLFGDEVTGVAFDGLTLREALAGNTCEREAGGAASVRATDGAWYDVVFDGPSDFGENEPIDAADCDGCGDTWFRGRAVDATCFDARPMFSRLP